MAGARLSICIGSPPWRPAQADAQHARLALLAIWPLKGRRAAEHLHRIAALASRLAAALTGPLSRAAALARSRTAGPRARAAGRRLRVSDPWATGAIRASLEPCRQHPRYHVRQPAHLRVRGDMDGHLFLGRQILRSEEHTSELQS